MTDKTKNTGYEWVVLSVTTVGVLMATMQSSALLIALPDIMSALHMDMLTVMWVLLIYMLITTAMVPLFGRMADMFGTKKLYVLGFAVFTLGSLLCVFASPDNKGYDLIAFRIVQGLGGALMMANATPMVVEAFSQHKLGFGLGINAIAAGAGLVVGPVVGGLLAPYGWQWIFLYNVPIGIFGTIWAFVRLKEAPRSDRDRGFDWIGTTVFLVGMTSLLMAVSLYAFPMGFTMNEIYLMFVIGTVGVLAFIWIELKVKTPMLDLRLFRNPDFAVGCTTAFLNALTRGAMLFLLIFFLQGPYGQDPLTAGLSLIPMGLTLIVVAPLAGKAADKGRVRILIIAGLALSCVSMFAFMFIDHLTPFWWLVVLMLLAGSAGSLFMSPNSKSVMSAAPPERRGIASGTRMMLMNVGSMVSMAIAMPMVLNSLSPEDMYKLFLVGGGISDAALATFENGLHEAFLLFFVISIAALALSLVKFKPAALKAEKQTAVYRRVLVATDGSSNSAPAVDYAIGLAKHGGAEVTAMCVIDEGAPEDMLDVPATEAENKLFQQGRAAVESAQAKGKSLDVEVRTKVVSGSPADEIARASADFDLIVMGTAGRTGVSHLLLGSVAEKVLRSAQTPVLVVREGITVGPDAKPRKILIPTDGSANTTPAIEAGLRYAKIFGTEVTALSVALKSADRTEVAAKETAKAAVEAVVEAGKKAGVVVRPLVAEGVPADEIVKAAADYNLVVMGTVGRTGMAHIRLGSVAETTVRLAKCPVLVVRARAPKQ